MGEYVRTNKKKIVQEQFAQEDEKYALPFQNLISTRVDNVSFNVKPGDKETDVE